MISSKEAALRLKAAYQDREIKECGFYKKRAYLFVAPRIGNKKTDFDDPYFLVDARTGRVSDFDAMSDLAGLQDALVNHPVEWGENSK